MTAHTQWIDFNPHCTVCRVWTVDSVATAFAIAFMEMNPDRWGFSSSEGYFLYPERAL